MTIKEKSGKNNIFVNDKKDSPEKQNTHKYGKPKTKGSKNHTLISISDGYNLKKKVLNVSE